MQRCACKHIHVNMVKNTNVGTCVQEELEAQVSLLQGQINDLEAMSKYCAKMMNVHIGESNRPLERKIKRRVEGLSRKITAWCFFVFHADEQARFRT